MKTSVILNNLMKVAVIAVLLWIVIAPFTIPERQVKYQDAQAIDLGNRYFHCDTIHLTTSDNDCTWTTSWYEATIFADTVDMDIKIGAPDTGSWSSRLYARLLEGMSLTIGPNPQLKKITAKTVSGSGRLYIMGYKNVRQY